MLFDKIPHWDNTDQLPEKVGPKSIPVVGISKGSLFGPTDSQVVKIKTKKIKSIRSIYFSIENIEQK